MLIDICSPCMYKPPEEAYLYAEMICGPAVSMSAPNGRMIKHDFCTKSHVLTDAIQ